LTGHLAEEAAAEEGSETPKGKRSRRDRKREEVG
jgi:hypothetical protein